MVSPPFCSLADRPLVNFVDYRGDFVESWDDSEITMPRKREKEREREREREREMEREETLPRYGKIHDADSV